MAKIEVRIKRLEGAKSELQAREAKRTEHRFTPLSSGLLVGAGVSLLATIVFGAQAVGHDRQARDFVVRYESGIGQRQAIVDWSKSEAMLANVFGAVTIIAPGGSDPRLHLEFPKARRSRKAPPPPKSAMRVCPSLGGGTVSLEVVF